MVSTALTQWRSARACRLDRLLSAHVAVGGSGAGRRWATEELNHALVLRLASEFQGFCRDLHNDAVEVILAGSAAGNLPLQQALRAAHTTTRRLDRGNADSDGLRKDFSLFGMNLWSALTVSYPAKSTEWRRKLELLNETRNGLAHDDGTRLVKMRAAGWSPTLASVRRWRAALDGLATGMDHVTGEHLRRILGVAHW
jgi:hypothetical protein